jgi:hypothetical protein
MDRGIEFQQRTSTFPFGIVLVRARSHRLQHLSPLVPAILAAILAAKPGRPSGSGPGQVVLPAAPASPLAGQMDVSREQRAVDTSRRRPQRRGGRENAEVGAWRNSRARRRVRDCAN